MQDRLEAFRLRNRGSKQRARENRREAATGVPASRDCRSTYSTLAQEPVAGSSAGIVVLEDEDWGDAAVDLLLLLEEDVADGSTPPAATGRGEASEISAPREDMMLVPWVPPPPPEVEILPGGIPVTEFATQISEWKASGMT